MTGLSRSVVAQTVGEMVAEGLLVQAERDAIDARESDANRLRARGRPSAVLQVAARPGAVGAVELGHHHVAIAVGDLLSHVLFQEEKAFAVDTGAAPTFELVDAMLSSALRRLAMSREDLRAVTVSLPFPVVGGIVEPYGDVPGWRGVRPGDLLRLPAGTEVVTENDANMGAWGEYTHGPDHRAGTLAYFRIGDGLGSGLVIGGEVFGGAHGMTGEIGHVTVPGCSLPCRCGRIGCVDAVVTAATSESATTTDVRAAGDAVGTVLAQIASFLDPHVIVMGGALGVGSPEFLTAVTTAYHAHGVPNGRVAIRPARLGLNAERRGALDRATQVGWASHILPGIG